MRLSARITLLVIALFLSACASDPVAEAEREIAKIVTDCKMVESGVMLIPCEVGVKIAKSDLADEVFHVCREVSSHSLVRRSGYIYDGIGRVEGDPAVAWVYAYSLAAERLAELTALKTELVKNELSGFGVSKWSDRCSKVYFASLEIISRQEGL